VVGQGTLVPRVAGRLAIPMTERERRPGDLEGGRGSGGDGTPA
jgi:hypothetical protein